MHNFRLGTFHEIWFIAVAGKKVLKLFVGYAGKDRRIGNLVAVQMKDGQYRAVADGIQKLVRMPRGGQRPGFGLAVSHDAGDEQVGIIESRAECVRNRIAELATLVDRTRCLRCNVTGYAARERKLFE